MADASKPYVPDRVRHSRFEPANEAERIARGVGEVAGTTASPVVPGMGAVNALRSGTAASAIPGMRVAASARGSVTDEMAKTVAAQPDMQLASSTRLVAPNENAKPAFNRAAFEKAPLLKGEGLDAAPPGSMQQAFGKVSDQFGTLAGNVSIRPDGRYAAAFDNVGKEFSRHVLAQIDKGAWDKLRELRQAGAAIDRPGAASVEVDGRTWQDIRGKLSSQLAETTDGQLRQALVGMIDALDDVASRSVPKDMAKEWADARRSWRALSMIDDAARAQRGGEAAVRNIPPGLLKSAFATGEHNG